MKLYIFNNIEYYIGENSKDNWDLLDKSKSINEDYIWIHLNSFPSPYVIIYSTFENIKRISNNYREYILFGCNLCLENSKYKNQKDVKFIYSPLKKLKKCDKIGEVSIIGKKNIISII